MTIERAIHGICSTERAVDHSQRRDGSDLRMLLTRGVALATPVPLLLNHSGDPVGRVLRFRQLGSQIYCIATVTDAEVWTGVINYRLRGLSIGFTSQHHEFTVDEQQGVVRIIDRSRINEISIVARPLNQDCRLAVYAGGMESSIAGQRSRSQHRQIIDRARALLARLDKQYPSKAENPSKQRPKEVRAAKDRDQSGLPPAELRRVLAWLKTDR